MGAVIADIIDDSREQKPAGAATINGRRVHAVIF
jgi:hypothetical protein